MLLQPTRRGRLGAQIFQALGFAELRQRERQNTLLRQIRRAGFPSARPAMPALVWPVGDLCRAPDMISIVIPALNEENAIVGTIERVRATLDRHDLTPYEILVVDDGST